MVSVRSFVVRSLLTATADGSSFSHRVVADSPNKRIFFFQNCSDLKSTYIPVSWQLAKLMIFSFRKKKMKHVNWAVFKTEVVQKFPEFSNYT